LIRESTGKGKSLTLVASVDKEGRSDPGLVERSSRNGSEQLREVKKSTHLGYEPSSEIDTTNGSRSVKVPSPVRSRLSPLSHTSIDIDSRIVLSQLDRLSCSLNVRLKELVDTLSGLLRLEVWASVDRVLSRRRKRSGCEKVGRGLRVDRRGLSDTFA